MFSSDTPVAIACLEMTGVQWLTNLGCLVTMEDEHGNCSYGNETILDNLRYSVIVVVIYISLAVVALSLVHEKR